MSVISAFFARKPQLRAEATVVSPVAEPEPDYAEPEDYERPPVLTLRPWDYGHGLEPTAAGYGFSTPDGRIWAAHLCMWSTWKQLGVLAVNVVGEKYHLADLADPAFEPGQPMRLVPEPENPVDPKAIAFRNWPGDKTVGYVKKGSTSRLRNLLRGEDIRVMALSCRYDAPPPAGRRIDLKVVIFRPDCLVGAEHIPPHPEVFN